VQQNSSSLSIRAFLVCRSAIETLGEEVPMSEIGSGSSSSGVTEQARDQVQQVAGQAGEKLQEAKGQLGGQIRSEVDSRTTQFGSQVDSTAHSLRAVGKELRNQGEETPAKLADQIADKVEQVASYLTNSNGDKILRDAENFGRKQPWLVIGAGLAVGFAAARFLKASSGRRYDTMYGWRLPAGQASAVTGQVPPTAGGTGSYPASGGAG
jgi:ElaB/YqjD/DUF883 family membrane-anchored ribosome-binding protein